MAKYSAYIELDSRYESVVDEATEQRNPGFWENYIVHEDMARAIAKICTSLKPETADDQRSFWFHGTYGTGKTYSALVLKHLFEDPIENITGFMARQKLQENRNKFLSIRQKGQFLVVWKSGCTGISTGNRLLLEMEQAIRQTLSDKLGTGAYFGRKSVLESVKEKVNDPSINWENIFIDPVFQIDEEYESVEAFRALVMANDLKACDLAAKVIVDKGWGLFDNVERFKEWITDVIDGNQLKETGIVFIWDEFTSYLRQSRDSNVLQNLAEFCRQQPFYMMLIVHRDSTFVADFGEQSYAHMVHRYHELEFNISESAAYQLIGDSILVRPGMEKAWKEIQQSLITSIQTRISDFMDLSLTNEQDILKSLCPIHAMTLALLSKVSGNFAASQRTLFRFLKDTKDAAEDVGFIYYINQYGPDDWRWLTPDFLWDYFFMRDSDVRQFGEEAKACFRHYSINAPQINDAGVLRVFKTAMLLIAVMGTSRIGYRRHAAGETRIKPSVNTLVNCFIGQLDEAQTKQYIESLQGLNMLVTVRDGHDYRIERPYNNTGNGEDIETKKAEVKRNNTPAKLLGETGDFSKSMIDQFLDTNKAISKRISVMTCSADTAALNARVSEMTRKLEREPHKFGLLLTVATSSDQNQTVQERLKQISENDETKRLVVVSLKKLLDMETLDEWYDARANQLGAADAGMAGNADQYGNRGQEIVATWASVAVNDQMTAYYGGTSHTPIYDKDDLARKIEQNIILRLFFAAPEKIIKGPSTVYAPAQDRAALAAITLSTADKRIANIIDAIKITGLWDVQRLEDFPTDSANDGAKALGELARFIRQQLADNPKVSLQELWEKLQQPPFGYYDTLACAYLIGFVMRFLKNSTYYWFDGTNPNILTEQNLATMIVRLCKNNVTGNTLSAGSETDRRFRECTQDIFLLAPQEAVNEEQTRKYLRARISKLAMPIWAAKYLPAESFGGVEMKNVASNILDKYVGYVRQSGDQNAVMEDVLTMFKGMGPLRRNLKDLLRDISALHGAFKAYLLQTKPELQEVTIAVGLSPNELFDEIKQLMQDEVWSWTEEQVRSKIDDLFINMSIIAALNDSLNAKRKTIAKLCEDISNRFGQVKVPGVILSSSGETWVGALGVLREIEQKRWFTWDSGKKIEVLKIIKENAKEAWTNVADPQTVLEGYLCKIGVVHSEEDIKKIYDGLSPVPYDFGENEFRKSVIRQYKELENEKKRAELVSLWERQSGASTVSSWCEKYGTPIQWVIPSDQAFVIPALHSIESKKSVDLTEMDNAIYSLKIRELENLRDEAYIRKCFFAQTEDRFASIAGSHFSEMIIYIRSKCGMPIYEWANDPARIKKAVDGFIREKLRTEVIVKAQTKVLGMDEKSLKDKLAKLIEENSDIGILMLKE